MSFTSALARSHLAALSSAAPLLSPELAMADEELKTLKRYTWEEVKEHRSSDSLWIVVNGKVYDVTPFLDEVCWCGQQK